MVCGNQSSDSQETLFGTLTLAQLDRLVAQDGALTACETRIAITSGSRMKIGALVKAVRAHLEAHGPVQRGDALSL